MVEKSKLRRQCCFHGPYFNMIRFGSFADIIMIEILTINLPESSDKPFDSF